MGTKITELATITDVASNDLLTGVDVSDTSGSANGTNKKFTKASLLSGVALESYQLSGWNPLGETLVYVSATDPIGIVKVVGKDLTSKLSVGMRLMFTNGGNVIKAIITAITFSTDTTITFLHEIDPTDRLALTLMGNSAITLPFFSSLTVPYGFSNLPSHWTISFTPTETTSTGYQSLATILLPVGVWIPEISSTLTATANNTFRTGDHNIQVQLSLSTANNSFAGSFVPSRLINYFNTQGDLETRLETADARLFLTMEEIVGDGSTVRYLVARFAGSAVATAASVNTKCRFVCAYL